ncbi:MAG: hypothetical protein KAW17_06895 [Candidatus Eisenbacteria sp.]|nr:hypothetical protein [Candidatus Eisenbacteria bacterium]
MPCLVVASTLIFILTVVAPGPYETSIAGDATNHTPTVLTVPVGVEVHPVDFATPADPTDWDFAIENLARNIALDMELRYQRSLAEISREPVRTPAECPIH